MGSTRRTLTRALVLFCCCALALAAAGTAAAATGRRHHHDARPSTRQIHAALVDYLHHNDPLVQIQHTSGTTATSNNWSGWVDTSSITGKFTRVAAAWKVPSATACDARLDSVTVDWIGLDGWSDGTVEQDGTLEWCYKGTATYYTWWEMYPTNSIQTVGTTVQPGDSISTSVARANQTYTLALTDSTHTANSFKKVETCTSGCNDTSAEWIRERPGTSDGLYPLAEAGPWNVAGGSETAGGVTGTIATVAPVQVTMEDLTGAYPLASPSALGATGKTFTATWKAWW